MPEGTGMWLGCWEMSAHFCIHLLFGTFAHKLPSILLTERKISFKKAREGLNRSRVHTSTFLLTHLFSVQRKSLADSLCAYIDKADKGHRAFVCFTEATAFAGCVAQRVNSLNGLMSERLKYGVSACLLP